VYHRKKRNIENVTILLASEPCGSITNLTVVAILPFLADAGNRAFS